MRFKTDENLPAEVAELLNQAGHDALRVDEQGCPASRIRASRRFAWWRRGRSSRSTPTSWMCAVTPPGDYAVILVHRPHRQTVPRILNLTRRFVGLLAAEPLRGKLWIVDEGRARIRPEDPP
jgi:uncharacterized protein DUF5615